eukprot:Sdes_comp20555_c0_seq1m15337
MSLFFILHFFPPLSFYQHISFQYISFPRLMGFIPFLSFSLSHYFSFAKLVFDFSLVAFSYFFPHTLRGFLSFIMGQHITLSLQEEGLHHQFSHCTINIHSHPLTSTDSVDHHPS